MSQYGTLYLIPCTLGDTPAEQVIPSHAIDITKNLEHFVVEQAKTARQFLSKLGMNKPIQEISMVTLNKHTSAAEKQALLAPLLAGFDVGVLSEAGCPGIADPGADIVALAQQRDIKVIPLVGPSSILLALMASGLNGQCFAFHGYLPIEEQERKKRLSQLEKISSQQKQTQIFIETPFRNEKLFQFLLQHCQANTRLCVATDITLISEHIVCKTIKQWQAITMPELNRRPSIFLLLAA